MIMGIRGAYAIRPIAYAPVRTGFEIHLINWNQIFDLYLYGRIAYNPECIGQINHLSIIIGIRGAYAIRTYTDNLITARNRIQ